MLSPNYIISNVFEMQERIKEGKIDKLEQDYSEFKERFPAIYEKASKPMDKAQMDILLLMMSKCQSMNENKSNLHDNSVDIGQVLVDKYIKPRVSGT